MAKFDGVFSLSRNPIYLSLTLLYIGISLLFSALGALLLLLPLLVIVQIGVVKREEIYLERFLRRGIPALQSTSTSLGMNC